MSDEPWIDLRSIQLISANIIAYIGLFLNGLLIYLIFFKTTKLLNDYKLILIQNCFVDIFFTIINEITSIQTESKNGYFILLTSGKSSNLPFPYNFTFVIIGIFALFLCSTSLPVQFVYRYFIIVRKKHLSIFHYFCCISFSATAALSYVCFAFYVFWPQENNNDKLIALELIKSDIFYFQGIPQIFTSNIFHWRLRCLFIYAMILVGFCYGIIIISCIKVWNELNYHGSTLSLQTQKIHKQMTKTIIFQALVPLIFVMFPIGVAVISTFAQINIPGFGIFIASFWCWVPITNPLVTICSIKAYRRVIKKIVMKIFNIKNCRNLYATSQLTTINPISNGFGTTGAET